jgi:hypothetical protein
MDTAYINGNWVGSQPWVEIPQGLSGNQEGILITWQEIS